MTMAPVRPSGDDDVVVVTTSFADARAARGAEAGLGDLSADGALDVLDGAVCDWSGPPAAPRWRPVENLVRLSPLPASVWTDLADHLVEGGRRGRVPLPDGAALHPGGHLLVVFLADGSAPAGLCCRWGPTTRWAAVPPVSYLSLLDGGRA